MGSSSSYKGAPGWSAPKDPGNKANAKQKYSSGSPHGNFAEGTHQSGPSDFGRTTMSGGARNKSSKSKGSAKNSGPYGRS